MKSFHWGAETWLQGRTTLIGTINGGKPTLIKRIDGAVTATARGDYPIFEKAIQRQSLVMLTGNIPPVEAVATPPHSPVPIGGSYGSTGWNNEIDSSLLMVNMKVIGLDNQVVPVHVEFIDPILLPDGILVMTVDTVGPGPLVNTSDALDTEIHLTIQWEPAP